MSKLYAKGEGVYFEIDEYIQRHVSAVGIFLRDVSHEEFDALLAELKPTLYRKLDEDKGKIIANALMDRGMMVLIPIQHRIWSTTNIARLVPEESTSQPQWVPDDKWNIVKTYTLSPTEENTD